MTTAASSVPTMRPDGRHYSKATRDTARKLHRAGWSYRRIAVFMGVPHQTVRYWCSVRAAERTRVRERDKRQRARALKLAGIGLTGTAIHRLMTATHDRPPSTTQINRWIREEVQ